MYLHWYLSSGLHTTYLINEKAIMALITKELSRIILECNQCLHFEFIQGSWLKLNVLKGKFNIIIVKSDTFIIQNNQSIIKLEFLYLYMYISMYNKQIYTIKTIVRCVSFHTFTCISLCIMNKGINRCN